MKEKDCQPVKPVLKWAGGKRWLVPELKKLWKPECRLVEPFCGGLAVALGLQPKKALLNDLNPYLINFYQQVQKGFHISLDMKYDKETYYNYRDLFNTGICMGETNIGIMAGLFYYLNRSGFNGLCRFNKKGLFNVPFGRYKTVTYEKEFPELQEAIKNWRFSSLDFSNISMSNDSDFIYADPPYDTEFTQYCSKPFTWKDQKHLAMLLATHPGPVVTSNQATERILDLYKNLGFNIKLLDGPRRISRTGDRTPAKEMLATRGI